jgi:hypothetical protein
MLNFYPPFLCRVLAAILKMADILKTMYWFPVYHFRCMKFKPLVIWIWNQNIAMSTTVGTSSHITPPSFMKFCPVVPEICRGQVHASRKERKNKNNNNKNNNKKRSKNNKSPKLCLEDLIRNGAKTISLQTLFGRLNYQGRS